jgi:hypothetical protein
VDGYGSVVEVVLAPVDVVGATVVEGAIVVVGWIVIVGWIVVVGAMVVVGAVVVVSLGPDRRRVPVRREGATRDGFALQRAIDDGSSRQRSGGGPSWPWSPPPVVAGGPPWPWPPLPGGFGSLGSLALGSLALWPPGTRPSQ